MSLVEIAEEVSAQYRGEIVDPEMGTDINGKRPPQIGSRQVKLELEGAIEDYKETRAEDIHRQRLQAINKYLQLGKYAYEQYVLSCNDKLTKTSETTDHPEHGEITKEKEVVEVRTTGNPSFLNLVKVCNDEIVALEAIMPPRKTTLTNPDGTEPFKFEGMEEFKRLAALADELLNPQSGNIGQDIVRPEVKHGE